MNDEWYSNTVLYEQVNVKMRLQGPKRKMCER